MNTDFSTLLETLERAGYPFVLYRYPFAEHINILIDSSRELRLLSSTHTDEGFVISPFDSAAPSVVLRAGVKSVFPLSGLPDTECDEMVDIGEMVDKHTELVNKDTYMSLVTDAINVIQQSDIDKIVTSRVEEIEYDSIDMAAIYASMCRTYRDAFVYYFSHPRVGRWAGASPELLALRRGDSFHTMSLAGTQKYEGEVLYRWGEKEVEEQAIVTRYICDVLSRCGMEDIKVKGPENHRAGGVIHLCSHISGQMGADVQMDKVLSALSPTPALCGNPKELSMMFLKEKEKHNRAFYGGYVGEVNMAGENTAELYVNIRCMQICDDRLLLYAGGGITAQSSPESEWEETCHKMKTMCRVIAPYVYRLR
ncbi:MAG: chorismate-binding protein [Flavobacteriales bacterium]|nr:chorismate-binding protein [Flavobacteriales bacterium]